MKTIEQKISTYLVNERSMYVGEEKSKYIGKDRSASMKRGADRRGQPKKERAKNAIDRKK